MESTSAGSSEDVEDNRSRLLRGEQNESRDKVLTKIDESKNAISLPKLRKVALKKELTLLNSVTFVLGGIIGSGIFITPSAVLEQTGSFGLSLIAWAVGGLIAICGGLSYCELGTFVKNSGGEYAYLLEAYSFKKRNSTVATLGEVVAFAYLWTSLVTGPASMAIITLAFGSYLSQALSGGSDPPAVSVKLLALAALVLVAVINSYSLKLTAYFINVLSFAKSLALLFIIALGIWQLTTAEHSSNFTNAFGCTTKSPGKIGLAFYSILWAYSGWNILCYTVEEGKDTEKNLPRAVVISVPIVTALYVFVNIAFFAGLSKAEVLSSEAIALTFGEAVLGKAGLVVIPLLVAVSTLGAANEMLYGGSRLTFAAARDGKLPEVLCCLHNDFKTPVLAVVCQTSLSLVLILVGSIENLIDGFSVATWVFYGLVFVGLVIMRVTHKQEHRPYKVWIPVPIAMIMVSVFLVVVPMVLIPEQRVTSAIALATISLGLPIYFLLARKEYRWRVFDRISERLTLLVVKYCDSSSTRPFHVISVEYVKDHS